MALLCILWMYKVVYDALGLTTRRLMQGGGRPSSMGDRATFLATPSKAETCIFPNVEVFKPNYFTFPPNA